MGSIKISVVIPTMNRPETLRQTLDSFFAAALLPDQVIIIDQTAEENKRAEVRRIADSYGKACEYIYQAEPSSTVARNTGIDRCRNDIIVFSDDDVSVEGGTLQSVADIMTDTTVSMIAGINKNDGFSTSKIGYLFGKKSRKKRNIGHVTAAMLGRFPEQKVSGQVKTEWAMGFFFAVRRSLVEQWGLRWDEALTSYAYAEDLDFSYSYYKYSEKENYRCILDERVAVEHRVSTEWRVPSGKSTRMYVINRTYLSYKHQMGVGSRWLVRWCHVGDFIERLLKKARPFDILAAQRLCDKHRKEIAAGALCPEWYEK